MSEMDNMSELDGTTDVVKKKLLIVEDDVGLQAQLKWHFTSYQVVIASDRESAIAALRLHEPEVVLQDLGLPPDEDGVQEGLRTMQEMLRLAPYTKVIVVTGSQDYENAIHAVALGAFDFYQKPVNTTVLDLIVQRAYQMYKLERQNQQLKLRQQTPFSGLIASDAKMLRVCDRIEKIAPTDITCLLIGESGTGKEVLARAIHDLSPRKDKPFIAINCAAIPEGLIESELFGHERGAFTGADKQTIGRIESADKGTLFLDELGDMPLAAQVKVLRFIQERVIERVGGRVEIPLDIRIVCATNQDLKKMVSEGRFREDLFFRVCELQIDIPALRDRGQDKVLIARHLLQKVSQTQGMEVLNYTDDAIAAIEGHDWPGNVRELESKVKYGVIMCNGKFVTSDDLGLSTTPEISLNLRVVRESADREAISKSLVLSQGNISTAAKLLGVTRPTLYDLIKKYDISTTESLSSDNTNAQPDPIRFDRNKN